MQNEAPTYKLSKCINLKKINNKPQRLMYSVKYYLFPLLNVECDDYVGLALSKYKKQQIEGQVDSPCMKVELVPFFL